MSTGKDTILKNLLPIFLVQKQYISANKKCPVFLIEMNFYNRHRGLLIFYWMGSMPGLGHKLVSASCYHRTECLNRDMFDMKQVMS